MSTSMYASLVNVSPCIRLHFKSDYSVTRVCRSRLTDCVLWHWSYLNQFTINGPCIFQVYQCIQDSDKWHIMNYRTLRIVIHYCAPVPWGMAHWVLVPIIPYSSKIVSCKSSELAEIFLPVKFWGNVMLAVNMFMQWLNCMYIYIYTYSFSNKCL